MLYQSIIFAINLDFNCDNFQLVKNFGHYVPPLSFQRQIVVVVIIIIIIIIIIINTPNVHFVSLLLHFFLSPLTTFHLNTSHPL